MQKESLVVKMLGESICDRILRYDFEFNVKVKKYLLELNLEDARSAKKQNIPNKE